MRRADLLLLTGVLLAAPVAARAQSWDAAGPGRDVLGAAIGEMDAFRGWAAAPAPREPVVEERRRLPRR
jgi:hypothetical protein